MALEKRDDPSNPSADYLAMQPDWELIGDIRAGVRAIKAKGEKYLPKYERESQNEYKRRLACTPWRPEFVDALRNLCSKPFTKEVALQGSPSQRIKDIAEDVDGKGNSLNAFSSTTFTDGVADGLTGIYVTYPDAEPAATQAEEKASGVRPYWVPIKGGDILALYTKKVGDRDVVTEIRFKECEVKADGFAEVTSERVRWIKLGTDGKPNWMLFEKKVGTDGSVTWPAIGDGALTVSEIPISLLFTGERSGNYRVKPPLSDLANMQIEIYWALSREDEILTYAGSPMLKAVGMSPPQPTQAPVMVDGRQRLVEQPASEITVGPRTILFAPAAGDGVQPDWDFIQPNAENIKAVQGSVESKIEHFRRLALQPQTPGSGTITATSAAIDAAKAHSAVEAWANGLKDTLEQAFVFTAMWLKEDAKTEVSVHTDFGVDLESADEFSNLITMKKNGDLSQRTLWQEGQRRGILGPQFDADKEAEEIAKDQEGLVPEEQIDPATGIPIAN